MYNANSVYQDLFRLWCRSLWVVKLPGEATKDGDIVLGHEMSITFNHTLKVRKREYRIKINIQNDGSMEMASGNEILMRASHFRDFENGNAFAECTLDSLHGILIAKISSPSEE